VPKDEGDGNGKRYHEKVDETHTIATLFREVLQSANPRVLAVVVNDRRLTECGSLLSFTDTRVSFIANGKHVVTIVFSTAALFALKECPEARSLSAR
jgi:hypothetical protein